jgi:anti-anti-sigma factor
VLEITTTVLKPGVGVVKPIGRVTISTLGDRLDTGIKALLDQDCKMILVDLSGITHLDSTGIGKFIQYLNLTMRAGGKLHMVGAPPPIRESFRITRLDTVFQFYDSIEAALGS